MTMIHLKKKDIVKSKVRGVDLEFDNEKSATILGQKSAVNRDETFSKVYSFSEIKKGEEPKKYDFFEDTFLTMCKPTVEDGIWWIGSGENRRRDDDEAASEEEAKGKKSQGCKHQADQQSYTSSSAQQKDQEPAGVDPSGLTGRDAEFLKFQAEFERKRANKFHDELEKAKAENAKLLALLHKTQTKPHP
ncbi:hypothetical protein Dimus_023352 [Dionaea muscipula]